LWVLIEVAKNVFERQPVKDLCLKCGKCVASFPLEARDDVVQKAVNDRMFRGELLIMSEMMDGRRQQDFRASIVNMKHSMGIKFSVSVAIVDHAEFLRVLKMTPNFDDDKEVQYRSIEYTNEEMERLKAVVVKFDGLPENV
jgi:hypothetical protein